MRRVLIATMVVLLGLTKVNSQPPQGFSYQAAIRNANQEMLAEETLNVKVELLRGSAEGTKVYGETHTGVKTNKQGIVSLAVGISGTPDGSAFSAIDWSGGLMWIKVSVDFGDGNYISMSTTQLLSVPYALYSASGIEAIPAEHGQTLVHTGTKWQANSQISAKETVTITPAPGHNPEEPIFAVRNTEGEIVFAVYETGVKVFIDDSDTKTSKGGFAVGGLSAGKGTGSEYLKITPDSSYLNFRESPDKTSKGGFAVGGLSAGKPAGTTYFSVTPDLTSINFENTAAKTSKGGFAVGGLSAGKQNPTDYLLIGADSIRMYIDPTDPNSPKTSKGGFAVGGLSAGKDPYQQYLTVQSHYSEFRFDSDNAKTSKGGFAVGGLSAGKATESDYFTVTPELTTINFDKNSSKTSKGGFAVGGLSAGKDSQTDYLLIGADSIRMYIDPTDPNDTKTSKGGFAVGGLSAGKDPYQQFLSVQSHYSEFRFSNDNLSKTSKGGFAVGGLSAGKNDYTKDYFTVQSDNIVVAVNELNTKDGTKGAFKVGTLDSSNEFSDLLTVDKDSTIISNSVYTTGNLSVDGDINVGGSIGATITIDGYQYPTAIIGSQTWMTVNLRSTKWNNGEDLAAANYSAYGGQSNNIETYGLLYSKEAIINAENRKLCPEGWRIPTASDWNTLIENAKTMYPNDFTSLLSNNIELWWGTLNATNNSGFGAVPGGTQKTGGTYEQLESNGYYWILSSNTAIEQAVNFPVSNEGITTETFTGSNVGNKFSIRCIK